MKRIGKYKHHDLMNIKINYGGKFIKFNLFEELRINESQMDYELKNQPSHFAFISLLQRKLQTKYEELKQERKRIWAKLYLKAKNRMNGNRYYSDDMAKAYAETRKEFQEITDRCIKARDDSDTLYACVSGFLQRKDLLQTLSSNNRKQI